MKPLINFKTFITTLIYFSISLYNLQAYDPIDRFTLNCGTEGNSSDGQRTWTGDTNSKLLSSSQNNPTTTVSVPTTTQNPSINKIPYSTARLSHSIFNYSFPVTTGPKFLRLFFYPSTYTNGFNRHDASFTVISNGFTLLKDFNASLNADVEGVDILVKEYVINVGEDQRLDLSLIPNNGNSNNYAFINGIEVISMPNDLYYTPPEDNGFPLVGTTISQAYTIPTTVALQTDYRIKVGPQPNSPDIKDTGMLRNWNINDTDYLNTPTSRDFVSGDVKRSSNITVTPDYMAPKELFKSSRDLDTNSTLNRLLNLTWEFPVDSGFFYLIRLHFCELDPRIAQAGDRVFTIYLQGQMALEQADVMKWTENQKSVAVQRNYAISIPKSNNNKKVNLSLQMHPYGNGDSRDTIYGDAFLNGLEIFKISDNSLKNLAGPNPDLIQDLNNPLVEEKNSKKRIIGMTLISVILVAVFSIVLISLAIFFALRRKKESKGKKTITTKETHSSKILATMRGISRSRLSYYGKTTQGLPLPINLGLKISFLDLQIATENFDGKIIGIGGFGIVYKGILENGMNVAVKRYVSGSGQGLLEFQTEIMVLSKIRHIHLVSLIGYCDEKNEMILVYEYMEKGTLRDNLYNTNLPCLTWKQRLDICIGAAKGLHYLHKGVAGGIIHRDVKSTNILLDENLVAKVSDFGLSRTGPLDQHSYVSTCVKGTFGYLDPDYFRSQQLTEKSDVYSFGVVLLEVLCARPAIDPSCPSEQVNLAEWGLLYKNNGKLEEIVDSSIKEQINQNSLRIFSEIVEKCLQDDGCDRPTMVDVLWDLEYALQLHREPNEDSSSSAFVSLQLRNDECLPSLSTLIEVDGMSIDKVVESTSTTLMTLDRISCEANQGTTINSRVSPLE